MQAPFRKQVFYWATQLIAWSGYVTLFGLGLWLNDKYEEGQGYALLLTLCVGIGASHLLRRSIRRKGLAVRTLGYALPRMTLTAVILGLFASGVQIALHDLLFPYATPKLRAPLAELYENALTWSILLLAWGVCYFAYHWFLRGRKEEIRNLRLESANREGQLAALRAQLNPHFMFNALNSIRALVDEDPTRAKQAITQLSSILRNAMSTVKRRTVPLGEELDVVRDYLALERMRFEERLRITFDIGEGLERDPVPPMLLQTLVENAVRHGIARLTQGGEVIVGARRSPSGIILSVRNSGEYIPGMISGTGIGLSGTRKRLEMLYGAGPQLTIANKDGMVVTEVEIPRNETMAPPAPST